MANSSGVAGELVTFCMARDMADFWRYTEAWVACAAPSAMSTASNTLGSCLRKVLLIDHQNSLEARVERAERAAKPKRLNILVSGSGGVDLNFGRDVLPAPSLSVRGQRKSIHAEAGPCGGRKAQGFLAGIAALMRPAKYPVCCEDTCADNQRSSRNC